ncbi:chemotaxis protein CheB [Natrarchaeobaculum aegyptiacum]|uniref:protein-glutamate methylesterase n=1 Tax=Natrarchaeobaculum aegyptiacum TaxID=745377 RepID=A0A2Z2HV09_9EURY|nr:chemotaxis protein CheB [Natrarchaeobaculum aegyptiacum]ARS88864.1 hypothetical protein B1756_03240 [Natrarchaeobaculum aegyptiacum]
MTRVLVADDPLELGTVVANALATRAEVLHATDLVPATGSGSETDDTTTLCETVARCRPAPDVVVAAWPTVDRARLDALRRLLGSDPVATLVITAAVEPAVRTQLEAVTCDAVDVLHTETTDLSALDDAFAETLCDRITALSDATVSSLAVAQTAATASSIQSAHAVCADSRATADSGAGARVGGTDAGSAMARSGRATNGTTTTTTNGAAVSAGETAGGSVDGIAPKPLEKPTPRRPNQSAAEPTGEHQTDEIGAVSEQTGPESSERASERTEPTAHPTESRDGDRAGHVTSRTPGVPPTVVIGASTGGPAVVEGLLARLPTTLEARVFVVQHMPGVFTGRFADRLDAASDYAVVEPADGKRVDPGTAVVAPGDTHLRVRDDDGLRVTLEEAPSGLTRPSIDVTMESAARTVDGPLCGVVCTGMGRDGAAGIEAIAAAGGHTIAQDEATSSVFGIPGQAIRTGCVDEIVPADLLPDRVVEALGGDQRGDG